MHKFARFLDPRNTIEGKIVTAILLVVLVFSMANLSAIVENASATGSNDNASNKTETELSVSEGAAGQTEDGAGSYADANTVNKPMVITALDQENGKEDVESQSSVAGGGDSSKVNPSEVTVGDPEGKTPEGDSPDQNMLVAQSDEPVAQNETYFDTIKKQIEDPNGPSEVALSESFTATTAITVSRDVTIAGADNISIDRDLQTHSIFVVEKNGNLTLNNVKLTGLNEKSTGNYTKSYVSPVVAQSDSALLLENSSIINGFAAKDGGAITALTRASVIVDNSAISRNKACNNESMAYGGGIQADGADVVLRNNARIEYNVADAYTSDPTWRAKGGIGGGINLVNGANLTIENASVVGNEAGNRNSPKSVCRAGAGGGIAVNRHCGLIVNNGTIEKNGAFASQGNSNYYSATYGGGGIYIGSAFNDDGEIYSEKVKLNSGSISSNFSNSVGGGIYVHNNSELSLVNTLITGNRNDTAYGSMGGGVYICGAGSNASFATEGCLVTGNQAAISRGHGDDYELEDSYYFNNSFSHISTRQQDGTKIDWYLDSRDSRFDKETSLPIDNLQEYLNANRGEKGVSLHSETPSLDGSYSLRITGNSADIGAGIGCNGYLYLGEQKDISLSLKKLWKNADGSDMNEESLPNSIKVNVYNKGKLIDEVVLSKENGWQKTLIDLPYNGDYTVKEIDENGNEVSDYSVGYQYGSVAEGENGPSSLIPGQAVETAEREYDVTITNTAAVPFGELVINKSFSGAPFDMGNGVGTSTAVFHVEGFQPVVAGSEGNLDDASQFTKFYDNYVSINYGDENPSVVLSDLPTGATYRVTEILYADSGFISNGQTIQTQLLGSGSDSKIEFSFDNTIDGEHPNQGIVNRYSFSSEGNTVNGNRIEQAA